MNQFSSTEIFTNPVPKYTTLIMLGTWSIIFCLIVTQKTVKRNAIDYAKTLFETINIMSVNLD